MRDLLSKDHKRRLKLRERPDTGVYVEVCLSVSVSVSLSLSLCLSTLCTLCVVILDRTSHPLWPRV